MAEHLEIEQKFDVDAGFERPDRATLEDRLRAATGERITAADPVLHRLSATYFDTADGRLASRKITLRRRTGGTDEGWHLKLPEAAGATDSAGRSAGPTSRREVHAPLGTAERDVPDELAKRVAGVAGDLPLAPIAILDTERTVVTLRGQDGHVVAEIADDAVTARRLPDTGGPEDPESTDSTKSTGGRPPEGVLRWREIEVEVPEAAPALQRAAADLLFAAGARPAGHGSKLARVLSG